MLAAFHRHVPQQEGAEEPLVRAKRQQPAELLFLHALEGSFIAVHDSPYSTERQKSRLCRWRRNPAGKFANSSTRIGVNRSDKRVMHASTGDELFDHPIAAPFAKYGRALNQLGHATSGDA